MVEHRVFIPHESHYFVLGVDIIVGQVVQWVDYCEDLTFVAWLDEGGYAFCRNQKSLDLITLPVDYLTGFVGSRVEVLAHE